MASALNQSLNAVRSTERVETMRAVTLSLPTRIPLWFGDLHAPHHQLRRHTEAARPPRCANSHVLPEYREGLCRPEKRKALCYEGPPITANIGRSFGGFWRFFLFKWRWQYITLKVTQVGAGFFLAALLESGRSVLECATKCHSAKRS